MLKSIKCQVCGRQIVNNNRVCDNCGWVQEINLDKPDSISWSYNFVSYNKAKILYSQNKALKPNFDEFLECMRVYGELEFYLDNVHYGVITDSNLSVEFYEWNNLNRCYQKYKSIEDFKKKANINGILLSRLWEKVEKINVAT